MNAFNYFRVPIISAGLTNIDNGEGYEILVFHDQKRGIYRKIVLKDPAIRGMILIEDVENADVIFNFMTNRVDVEAFKHKLIADNFNLAALPEALRKQFFRGS
jgi:NAD(P)H-nitrite reductase large subunit